MTIFHGIHFVVKTPNNAIKLMQMEATSENF